MDRKVDLFYVYLDKYLQTLLAYGYNLEKGSVETSDAGITDLPCAHCSERFTASISLVKALRSPQASGIF